MTWYATKNVEDGLSVTATFPDETADGMALFALVGHEAGFGADTGLFTAVAGWELKYTALDTNGEDRVVGVYTRKASEDSGTVVFPHASSVNCNTSVTLIATDEVDADNPFHVPFDAASHKATQNNSNSPNLPSITTAIDNSIALAWSLITFDDVTAIGSPTGYTGLRNDIGFGGSYNDCQTMAAFKTVATAGLESPGSWNNTDNGTVVAESTSFIFALNPAPAGGPSITDVDGDGSVVDGQTGATVSLSGFTGTPTLKLKHGTFESPALSYTGDETGGTFDMPDYAAIVTDVVGAPIGQSGTKLLVENGAETAEFDITINPKAGWSVVVASGALTGEGYLPGPVIADNSVAYFPLTNNLNITQQMGYQVDAYPANLVLWNSDTGIVEKVTIEEAGDPDNEAPVIVLDGSYSPVILQGSVWTDPGYTATDNNDGDITASVVVGGTVDTNTLGMYPITYNVSDAAENPALQVVRTVTVVDEISAGLASQFGMMGMM